MSSLWPSQFRIECPGAERFTVVFFTPILVRVVTFLGSYTAFRVFLYAVLDELAYIVAVRLVLIHSLSYGSWPVCFEVFCVSVFLISFTRPGKTLVKHFLFPHSLLQVIVSFRANETLLKWDHCHPLRTKDGCIGNGGQVICDNDQLADHPERDGLLV